MHKQTGESLSAIIETAEEFNLSTTIIRIDLLKEALQAVSAVEELSADDARRMAQPLGVFATRHPKWADALCAYAERLKA